MLFNDEVTAYIITLVEDKTSLNAANNCIQSIRDTKSQILPFIFPAIKPTQVDSLLRKFNLEYSYPLAIERKDETTGLLLTPYKTVDINKRIACFFSHYILWKHISKQDPREPFVILEHDALFTNRFVKENFEDMPNNFICGLNSPIGATRKAHTFDSKIKAMAEKEKDKLFFPVPQIDPLNVPQGLAGNSSYVIGRGGSRKLLELVDNLGIWPNDAIMCQQFLKLFTIYPYITKVQGIKSTTSC